MKHDRRQDELSRTLRPARTGKIGDDLPGTPETARIVAVIDDFWAEMRNQEAEVLPPEKKAGDVSVAPEGARFVGWRTARLCPMESK